MGLLCLGDGVGKSEKVCLFLGGSRAFTPYMARIRIHVVWDVPRRMDCTRCSEGQERGGGGIHVLECLN